MKVPHVYQITNLINLKIYIGVHHGEPDDSYMGSGKAIKAAIKKYGIENFKKEIIAICESIKDAFKLESEIVNDEFIARHNVYNQKPGGHGGWPEKTVAMRHKISEAKKGKHLSAEHKLKLSEALKGKKFSLEHRRKITNSQYGRTVSEETRRKISESHNGKKLSVEHRRKISESHKGTKGMKFSDETRQKMRDVWKRRKAIAAELAVATSVCR